MYNFKRVIALGVVSTMILGSSLTAFASEPTESALTSGTATSYIDGTGTNEAGSALAADRHAFSVTVPTTAAIKQRLNYTIDLEGWIKETKGARYDVNSTSIDDSKGVMFVNYNSSNKATGMSNVSSPIIITNKGTDPIAVTVTAKWGTIAADHGISAGASDDKFATTANQAIDMYMGMYTSKVGNLTAMPAGDTETPLAFDVTSSKDQYVTAWDKDNSTYTYKLKDGVAASALSSVGVYFTGTMNPARTAADLKWSDESGDTPVTKAKVAPSLSVKFSASDYMAATDGYVLFKSNTYTIGKTAEGGLTGAVTTLSIDGKDITLGTTTAAGRIVTPTVNTNTGMITLASDALYTAYGYTAKPTDGWVPHVIKLTVGGTLYTVEPNKSK